MSINTYPPLKLKISPRQSIKLQTMPGAKGDKGDKGDTGDTGLQGPQGDPGLPGVVGEVIYSATAPVDPDDWQWWYDTTTGTLYFWYVDDNSGQWVAVPADVLNLFLTYTAPTGAIANIEFVIDGGGATITTGVKGDLEIGFGCTINRWTILGDQSGSIVIDIWKDAYGNFPPLVGDSITASAKPTVSGATSDQSSSLTGWDATIAAGDVLRFNVDSVAGFQRVTLSLQVTKA